MSIAATTRGAAVHWNGPPLGLTNCDGTRCAAVWEAIRRWQTETRTPPFRDIAYTFGVCPGCGTIHPGRGWGARTAANGTTAGNREWHAYMVMSGEGEPFTDAAKQALLRLHAEHRRRFGRGRLTTHRAVRNGTTRCAGETINAWVAAGGRPPAPAPPPILETFMAATSKQITDLIFQQTAAANAARIDAEAHVIDVVSRARAGLGLDPEPASDAIWGERIAGGSHTFAQAFEALTSKAGRVDA